MHVNQSVTDSRSETDAIFRLDPAAMAPRLGELTRRQIAAGLHASAVGTARLAAHNAFIADPTLRDERGE